MSDKSAFLAGAASGFTVRILTQPLDVLKIRFQLQIEPISQKSKISYYHGTLQAMKRIYTEEGIKGFWKGHIPAQYLSIIFGSVQFSSFNFLQRHFGETRSRSHDLVFGGVSGCVASVFCHPVDVLRTRLAGQGIHQVYTGSINAIITMWREEKIRGFFRGLFPSLVLIFPQTALQFMIYYSGLRFMEVDGNKDDSKNSEQPNSIQVQLINLGCGGVAGLISKASIYPLELTKRRLQIQGFEKARQPFGQLHSSLKMTDSLRKTFAKEGIVGLYKGLLPSSLKATIVTGLSFYFYQQFLIVFKRYSY